MKPPPQLQRLGTFFSTSFINGAKHSRTKGAKRQPALRAKAVRRTSDTATLKEFFSTVLATNYAIREALWSLLLPFTSYTAAAQADDRREDLRANIVEIRRALRVALSAGVDKDIVTALNKFSKRRKEFARAFIVWIDLIEILVQSQEQRYGPRSGLGALKSQQVKEVFRYLLRKQRIPLPNIPRALEPLILDVAIGWLVDAVVLIANSYGLWREVPAERSTFSTSLSLLWFKLKRLLKPLAEAVATFLVRLWEALRTKTVLSPALRQALDAVEREGMIDKSPELLTSITNLLTWIASHRKQLTAMVELVCVAVQEAESFFELTGPEKKAYARDVVLVALNELGFTEQVGFVFVVIDSLIDASIESAVHLFNKRRVFT